MNNEEKLKAIKKWQSSEIVHPLTCAKGGHNHRNLEGFEDGNEVKLKCLDCDYVQHWIPEEIFKIDFSKLPKLPS